MNVEVLKYLISQGADVNAKDSFGETLLYYAARSNPSVEVFQYLMYYGSIDARNMYGCTPLQYALTNPNVEIMRLLIARGTAVNTEELQILLELLHEHQNDGCFSPEERVVRERILIEATGASDVNNNGGF